MAEKYYFGLNRKLMERTSRKIIGSFREHEYGSIDTLYCRLRNSEPDCREGSSSANETKKRFYYLIKFYHPDTLQRHKGIWEKAKAENDTRLLNFYERMAEPFFFQGGSSRDHVHSGHAGSKKQPGAEDATFSCREEYWFSEDDLKFTGDGFSETLRDVHFDNTFMEALNTYFFGNLGHKLEPTDLYQIHGSLNVSHHELHEIDGLEYCINVSELDLSYNHLSNICNLHFLSAISELDLSHNDISDIGVLGELGDLEILYLNNNDIDNLEPLLQLQNLQFVDVSNNPLTGMDVIRQLLDDGVTVIYF